MWPILGWLYDGPNYIMDGKLVWHVKPELKVNHSYKDVLSAPDLSRDYFATNVGRNFKYCWSLLSNLNWGDVKLSLNSLCFRKKKFLQNVHSSLLVVWLFCNPSLLLTIVRFVFVVLIVVICVIHVGMV